LSPDLNPPNIILYKAASVKEKRKNSVAMVLKPKSLIYSREEAGKPIRLKVNSQSSVARVAYYSSDIVFIVQPNFTDSGSFAATLDHLYSSQTPNILANKVTQVTPV